MIVLYHKNDRISKVVLDDKSELSFAKNTSIAFGLMQMAERFPESKLVWCHEAYQDVLDVSDLDSLMHHNKIMLSYNPSAGNYLGSRIGYVEDSPFININKEVSYPTWQMSSTVGAIHTSVLVLFKSKIKLDADFDYYISSVAKVGMPLGLFCYSEPKLLNETLNSTTSKASVFILFRFVKQHYKTRWVFLLLLNLMVYEFRFPLLALVYALFFKNTTKLSLSLNSIGVQSNRSVVKNGTIDVIIPTIGRKKYLHDVLQDLAQQTHLPKNVIIVEQNPQENSISELDYLEDENWPFIIKHTFTNQSGVCNARNLALNKVESEWIFMADDDIRVENNFLAEVFSLIKKEGSEQITLGCYEPNYPQKNKSNQKVQWTGFGSGCSVVKSNNVKSIGYNQSFEFGYGEDTDFGMQLRNLGSDILFSPKPEILHLKASMGGFRTKPVLAWHKDLIQPKPSPTVMLYKILHLTEEQINGYKTILFFKYYRHQNTKNPILYLVSFRKQWEQSVYWANELRK